MKLNVLGSSIVSGKIINIKRGEETAIGKFWNVPTRHITMIKYEDRENYIYDYIDRMKYFLFCLPCRGSEITQLQ